MNPRQPYNPFSRDEYPALTDAINGVVNGQPREVEEAVTPAQRKVFNAERERMMTALNNPNKKLSPTEREAVLARGARNAAAEVRKGAVSPTGEKSPVHAQAKAYHEYARKESKKLDAIAKRKGVQESQELDERLVGGADFLQATKNLLTGKGFKTNREVSGARVNANMAAMQRKKAKSSKKAEDSKKPVQKKPTPKKKKLAKNVWVDRVEAGELPDKFRKWDRSQKERLGSILKGAVKESQELSERIIDEVDFFQASKNWVKGKGFKTNREVSYDRVEKNYQAMKKRQEAEAKKNK